MKAYLRNSFLKKRKGLKNRLNKKFSHRIVDHLASLLEPGAERELHILLFHPIRAEANVLGLVDELEGAHFYLPRCNGGDMEVVPYSKGAQLIADQMNIPAPIGEPVKASCLTTVLVPGLAFDTFGARLGYGKGFYDRFLKDMQIEKIGVCFSFQVQRSSLPVKEHDLHMNMIIHENGLLVCHKE